MQFNLLVFTSILTLSSSQFLTNTIPNITDVSAMCSSEGITAAIDFSDKFSGKIYSLDYATIHDCVYFNSLDTRTVLFSIPAHRCGTKLSRTSRNIIDQMENRVYVQMDKDMQSAADKQFNFICQLSDGRISKTVRRHPMRDSYVVASDAKGMGEPIKPKEVRIAASSDITFGNWPIPGSKPYNPSMKPSAVFPKLPVAGIINYATSPASITSNHLSSAQQFFLSEPIKANVLDHYPSPSTYNQHLPLTNPIQATIRRAPANPSLPTVSSENYVRPPINNYISSSFAKNPPIIPLKSPILEATTVPNKYVETPQLPINPDIHIKQGIGMGAVMGHHSATPVPARTWNLGQVTMPSNAYETTPSNTRRKFIEEPKRVGVEFTNDVNENTITVSEDSTPKVHLISTQEHFAPHANVQLEIQEGNGPFGTAVSKPVKIGENITLVVRALSQMRDKNMYDMFVHSCFATDGPGTTKIDLIDRDGCVIRKEFVSPLKRTRNDTQILYYFHISAFKFPGPDDVYFSCSIELTPLRSAPEICTTQRRTKRDVSQDMRLFDIVKVELAEKYENDKLIAAESQMYCGSQSFIIFVTSIVFCVLIAFTVSTTIAITLNAKLRSLQMKL
ncbi:unnamed protein product [Auanema sp. JU1783]|nr:unnamed protein product [Auanema sp. JU1783]